MTYDSSEIAQFITNTLDDAGDTIRAPKMQAVLLLCQGMSLRYLGRPAFQDAIKVSGGRTVAVQFSASYGGRPDDLPATPFGHSRIELTADLDRVVRAVLREFGGMTGFQLNDMVSSQSLLESARMTGGKLDVRHIKAYFEELPDLALVPDWPDPQVVFADLSPAPMAPEPDLPEETPEERAARAREAQSILAAANKSAQVEFERLQRNALEVV
ncbi:hypothetical protein ABS71_10505 [bacterium SCN 62-11]|nr:MAG: hypothetical protein ABS71_10505 [bacterium SCN 62-11]